MSSRQATQVQALDLWISHGLSVATDGGDFPTKLKYFSW